LTDRFALSLEALLVSALLAAPIPFVLAFLHWRLGATAETTDFTQALSHGLEISARLVFGGLLSLVLIKPYGLGGAHFRWPDDALRQLRRSLRAWLPVAAPLLLISTSLSQFADESHSVGLGRSAFTLLMLATAVFLAHLLSPRGAIVRPRLHESPPHRLAQLWWLWYPVVVGAPLAAIVLADAGYYYTATVLAQPFLRTLALFALATVVYALALRWLAVSRRSLALQLAREDREAALALQATAEGGTTADVPLTSAHDELAAIDTQTRQLLKTILLLGSPFALYAIWADTLPAFTLFQDITLWQQTAVVEGQAVRTAVTLGSLFVAILIGIVTGIAARNLPGMLEIVLLRHLQLKRGSRYAIKTLLQYTIVALGVLLAFGKLGASWSQIQWLVAALGVGLGFGLQEIFANFISGIILLFERPVRVGDRVTVGELTGTVTKISIRAVTITDLDHKEIIVPNKSFITTDVVNWTLSDSITRIILRVGIAYGSDVKRAHQVMLDTVQSLPLVRQDPKPEIWFAGFGDSSLDFDIYVFASELSDRFPLMHSVNVAVEKALRENGFEIPFPQRDLHLRTVDPGAGPSWRGGDKPDPAAGRSDPQV
jgi:potassium efflux system protein